MPSPPRATTAIKRPILPSTACNAPMPIRIPTKSFRRRRNKTSSFLEQSGETVTSCSMKNPRTSTVLRFVLLVGVVNLFADLTYEGGRSITGPFLAQLGATAATVSIVSGVGEFFGYALRAASGYLADKTGRYWTLAFAGYAINLLAVPALALAGSWPV